MVSLLQNRTLEPKFVHNCTPEHDISQIQTKPLSVRFGNLRVSAIIRQYVQGDVSFTGDIRQSQCFAIIMLLPLFHHHILLFEGSSRNRLSLNVKPGSVNLNLYADLKFPVYVIKIVAPVYVCKNSILVIGIWPNVNEERARLLYCLLRKT